MDRVAGGVEADFFGTTYTLVYTMQCKPTQRDKNVRRQRWLTLSHL
jgi:hypothetical protein